MTIAILIDPFAKVVCKANLNLQDFEEIYTLLKCKTVDFAPFGDYGDKLLVDDEGLFVPTEKQTYFTFATENLGRITLAGYGLVVGTNEGGDWKSPTSTQNDVVARTSWLEQSKGAAYAAQFR